MVSFPTIKISDIKSRRFNVIDRARSRKGLVIDSDGKASVGRISILDQLVAKARQRIMRREDEEIFKELDSVAISGNKEE